MLDAPLLDHLIGPCQQRRRNGQAQSLRGLEVDDEFESSRLLNRKVSGLDAFENFVDVTSSAPPIIYEARPIGHESPGVRAFAIQVNSWEHVIFREGCNLSP